MGRDRANNSEYSWKRAQVKHKWQSIVAVFITVTLLFAIVNGLVKGFSLKSIISKSNWDNKSSFTVAIDSINPIVFIFQKDPKNLIALSLNGDAVYETGKVNEPLGNVSSVLGKSGDELVQVLTHAYNAKIDNYLLLRESLTFDKDKAENMLISFASIATPFKLLTTGWQNNVENTNITRIDAFKLWWQLKGIGADELVYADLSKYQEEILTSTSEKILGINTAQLNRIISKYLENLNVLEENQNIKIVNSTNINSASQLAANMIESVGGVVTSVENNRNSTVDTHIITNDKNLYTAQYLANIFSCDIKEAKSSENEGEVTVVLGDDFSSYYF